MLYSPEWKNDFRQKYKSTTGTHRTPMARPCKAAVEDIVKLKESLDVKYYNLSQPGDLIFTSCICCGNVNVYHQACVLSCHLSRLLVHTIKSRTHKNGLKVGANNEQPFQWDKRDHWATGHNLPLLPRPGWRCLILIMCWITELRDVWLPECHNKIVLDIFITSCGPT